MTIVKTFFGLIKYNYFREEVVIMSEISMQNRIFTELRKKFPGLSEDEFDLFKVVMSHKDETFVFSRRILFTLEELITQVYEEVSEENYEKLSEGLVKLVQHIETNKNKKGDCHAYSLFSDLSINKEEFLGVEETLVTAYVTPIVLDFYRSE